MAALLAEVQASPTRVVLTLSAWPVDGEVAVFRVHADGSRRLVRGSSATGTVAVSGGVGAAIDYEAPYLEAVRYEALSGAGLVSSASVTLTVDASTAWLSVPGVPTLVMPVMLERTFVPSFPRQQTVLRPRGRSTAVVIGDVRQQGGFTAALRTHTFAEGRELLSMLAQSRALLLRAPGMFVSYAYVDVGDVVPEPLVHYRPAVLDGADSSDAGAWLTWSLPCVVVDAPTGANFGDPTASWDAVKAAGVSWDQLKNAGVTWLDMQRGYW